MSEINIDNFRKDELLTELLSVRAERDKLQQANDEAQSLIGLLEAEVGKLKRERDNYAEISIAKWCAKNYANKLNK